MFKQIADKSGVNQKGVERILASQRLFIEVSANSEQVLELGFSILSNLRGRDLHLGKPSAFLVEIVGIAIHNYSNTCPQVVGWLASGAFRADQIPKDLPPIKFVHACRTAGRLRAKVMRELQAKGLLANLPE